MPGPESLTPLGLKLLDMLGNGWARGRERPVVAIAVLSDESDDPDGELTFEAENRRTHAASVTAIRPRIACTCWTLNSQTQKLTKRTFELDVKEPARRLEACIAQTFHAVPDKRPDGAWRDVYRKYVFKMVGAPSTIVRVR